MIESSQVFWTSFSWSGKQNRDCPKLRYTYEVRDQRYEEYNQVFDFVCWPNAYDFVSKHQPGAHIRIAYDPNNPAITIVPEAMRNPGYPWGDISFGIVFTALLLIDLFGTWAASNNTEHLPAKPPSETRASP